MHTFPDAARHLTRRNFVKITTAGIALALIPTPSTSQPKEQTKPLLFAHRGACALRPEHTLASYAKAIVDGADYIEPDLVCTRDGVLV